MHCILNIWTVIDINRTKETMDYANGKIYKVLNCINDDVYVGSTCQSLSKRMSTHRARATSKPEQGLLYAQMKEYGYDKFYIELIEKYPCTSKEELNAKEGEWIRQIGTLNCRVAGRSPAQYRDEHREHKREYHRNHYQQNKEKTLNACKLYRETHRDNATQYYQDHREELLEKGKAKYRFKKIVANGNDLIYVSKNAVNVNDSDDDHNTNPPSDFIPVNESDRDRTI